MAQNWLPVVCFAGRCNPDIAFLSSSMTFSALPPDVTRDMEHPAL